MTHLDFEKPLVDLEERIRALREAAERDADIEKQIERLESQAKALARDIYADLTVWQKIQLSRHPERPYFLDYLERVFDDFVELHGDRVFSDDPAIVAGFARLEDRSVAVIGQQKGRTTKDKVRRNFGMAHPDGYRKAMRVMELAARFGRPVLTFIDTPGAYPGLGAEERGQSEAIGRSVLTMAQLGTPIVSVVIGEGGSGGALALGVGDRVLMMQYATYSVITPEGCASILWRDAVHAPTAAEQLKLLASDAERLRVIDGIIEEPEGGAHRDVDGAARRLKQALTGALEELAGTAIEALAAGRYAKYRRIGEFLSAHP